MGPRNDHWITEGNRRESERPAQVFDVKGGFIPSVSCRGSRKECVAWPCIHLDLERIFQPFRALAGHLFDTSIGSIWRTWKQWVTTVYRRA